MSDANDVYADQFQVNIGPYGCTLNFQLTSSTPAVPGSMPQLERVATVRMSLELLKAAAFILHRQLVHHETQNHVSVSLPPNILSLMNVRQEDWEAFWRP